MLYSSVAMKFFVLLLAVAAVAHSSVVPDNHSAYGYLQRSIKEGERIQQQEEEFLNQQSRIIGGVHAALGQYPYQAGILIDLIGIEHGRGICGASLISSTRLITAAHCWFDGVNQGWRVEVVLGSVTLFSGGNRQQSSVVVNHPSWFPALVRNDVAVIYLSQAVPTSNTIQPIALPSGNQLQENFADETAIASGFGLTQQGGSVSGALSHVSLRVLANSVCRLSFPLLVQDTNICTSGAGTIGACQGDSGGPLVVSRNNQPLLIGVVSFGSALGCEAGMPSVYARTTSFINFFNQHL